MGHTMIIFRCGLMMRFATSSGMYAKSQGVCQPDLPVVTAAANDRRDLLPALRAHKVFVVSTGDGLSNLRAKVCGFIGRPSEQRTWNRWTRNLSKPWLASRAYSDAQLSWHGRKPTQRVPGHRDSYSRWGSTLQRTRLPVCCRAAPGWTGLRRFGDDTAELLASAEQLLRRICVVGVPARLLGLRAVVAEVVWEANSGADT
jgi:hypothetical protein